MSDWKILGDEPTDASGWKILGDQVPGSEALGLPGIPLGHPSLQPVGVANTLGRSAVEGGKSLAHAATTPLGQQLHEGLGTGKQAATVSGLYGDVSDVIGNAADKYVQPVVDKVAGAGTYLGAKAQFGSGVRGLNEIPKAVAGLLDFGGTPAGMALGAGGAAIEQLPAAAKAIPGAAFATDMAPGAVDAAQEAYRDPSTENIVRAGVQGLMTVAPLAHAVPALRNREQGTPIVDNTNPETIRRPGNEDALRQQAAIEANPEKRAILEQQAAEEGIQLPSQPPVESPAEGSWKILGPEAEQQDARAEQQRTYDQLFPRPGPIAPTGEALAEQYRIETNPEKLAAIEQQAQAQGVQLPERAQVSRPAQEAAEAFNPTFEYQDLFDQAQQKADVQRRGQETIARKQAAREAPPVPETGIPENVARAVDARDRIAMQVAGKPFAELDNSERIVVDDLVSEGNVGAGGRPTPPALTPPPGQPIRETAGHPSLRRRVQVPEPETPLPSSGSQTVEAPAASGLSLPEQPVSSEPPRTEVIQQRPEEAAPQSSPQPEPTIPDAVIDRIAAERAGIQNVDPQLREVLRAAIAEKPELFDDYLKGSEDVADNRTADNGPPEPAIANEAQRGPGDFNPGGDEAARADEGTDQGRTPEEAPQGSAGPAPSEDPTPAVAPLAEAASVPSLGHPSLRNLVSNKQGAINPAALARNVQQRFEATKPARLNVRTQMTDDLARIEDLTHNAREKGTLAYKDDPYILGRIAKGVGGKIAPFIDKLGETMQAARSSKVQDAVKQYGLLERYEEISNNGVQQLPGGRTLADVQAEKTSLEQSLGKNLPTVKKLASEVTDYAHSILKYAHDGDLISDEGYNAALQQGQKYIPLQRLAYITDEGHSMAAGAHAYSVGKQNVIHALSKEGSTKEVADPNESLLRNTYKTVTLVERNKVAKSMGALADHPEFQGTVNRLKPSQQPQPGYDKFYALIKGVKHEYEAPKPLVDALKHLDHHQADIVTNVFRKSAGLLRAGATTWNVPFAIFRNPVRDIKQSLLTSKVGLTPVDWLKGFAHAVKHDAVYDEYMKSGAAISGLFETLNQKPAQTIKQLSEPKMLRVAKQLANPVNWVTEAGEKFELAPRIGTFERARKQGLSTEEAAYNSRNSTVDFQKAGTAIRVMNMWVPFLNARIQGNINTALALRDRPIRTAGMLTAVVGLPVAATYFNNRTNFSKEWDDIAQSEKDANNLIIYGSARDERGNPTQVIKIPKSEAEQVFGNAMENYLEYMWGNHPKQAQELAMEVLSNASPVPFERDGKLDAGRAMGSVLPPTAKGIAEGAFNKNLYTGRDIVPDTGHPSLQKATPKNQFMWYTPQGYVWLGDQSSRLIEGGVSPMKIQNFIETQLGGTGRLVSTVAGTKDLSADSLKETAANVGKSWMKSGMGALGGEEDRRQQKTLQVAEQQAADKNIADDRRIRGIADKIKSMKESGEDPRAYLKDLAAKNEFDEADLKSLTKILKPVDPNVTRIDKQLAHEPNEVRANYIIERLKSLPRDSWAKELKGMAAKKELTEKVWEKVAPRLQQLNQQ